MKKDFKKYFVYIPVFLVFFVVLVAGIKYILGSYTILLDMGYDDEVLTETYNIGSGDVPLENPKRSGYRFTGWTGSNGDIPQTDVVISAGTIGDKHYVANWSKKLSVTCEDWLIDAKGNLISNISEEIDDYLLEGSSSQGFEYQERTVLVKAGNTVNPDDWGTSDAYKAYSGQYNYIGNSGKIKVEEDGMVVYRYFYPILCVNYMIDGMRSDEIGYSNGDIASFNLYIDGKKEYTGKHFFRKPVPCNSWYYVEIIWTSAEFEHIFSKAEFGEIKKSRKNTDISFATRTGDYTASCSDYLVDADGQKIKDITNEVDAYLRQGKSSNAYSVVARTVEVNDGDVINAEFWGNDVSGKAYHGNYCYVGSSGDVTVDGGNIVVYRYFQPTLDITVTVNGMIDKKAARHVSFDLYVDDICIAEGIHSFSGVIPYGSTYEIRNASSDKGYVYLPDEKDSGIMKDDTKTLKISFVSEQYLEQESSLGE